MVNEAIIVGAVFGGIMIKPKWFIWNSRKYIIKKTTFTWQSREGEFDIAHFSVTDGSTLFEISLNKKTFSWHLEKMDEL